MRGESERKATVISLISYKLLWSGHSNHEQLILFDFLSKWLQNKDFSYYQEHLAFVHCKNANLVHYTKSQLSHVILVKYKVTFQVMKT